MNIKVICIVCLAWASILCLVVCQYTKLVYWFSIFRWAGTISMQLVDASNFSDKLSAITVSLYMICDKLFKVVTKKTWILHLRYCIKTLLMGILVITDHTVDIMLTAFPLVYSIVRSPHLFCQPIVFILSTLTEYMWYYMEKSPQM